MKVQSVVAVVASAALVSAAPGAIRHGSVAKRSDPQHKVVENKVAEHHVAEHHVAQRAPVVEPMYPSNCTNYTIIGGHSNCTSGSGSPPPPPSGHDNSHHSHNDHDGSLFSGVFNFVGGLLKSLVKGDKQEKRSMEPVYII